MKAKLSKKRAIEIYSEIIESYNIIDFDQEIENEKPNITIVKAIRLGLVEFDKPTNTVIQTLVSKIESGDLQGDSAVTKFCYDGVIEAHERKVIASNVDPRDTVEMGIRAISILSGQPEKIVGKLCASDWKVALEVVQLFL